MRARSFVPAGELSGAFYRDVARPLLVGQTHSAALLGWGSDVLGYDTGRSTDHGWGPRLLVSSTVSTRLTGCSDGSAPHYGRAPEPVRAACSQHRAARAMSFDIRLERLLDTTPDVAFHHWIDADERRRWYQGDQHNWGGGRPHRPAGGRPVLGDMGPTPDLGYREDEVFLVVEPPRRLVYSSRFTPMTPTEGEARANRAASPPQDEL